MSRQKGPLYATLEIDITPILMRDRNLATHGGEARYWYSVDDGFRLLMGIRKALNYDNEVALREEYSALRENTQRRFIADPYPMGNFADFLTDDTNSITSGRGSQAAFKELPTLIVIPVVDGMHWRAVKIEINYDSNDLNILWDDPYGPGSFPERYKERFREAIINNVKVLIASYQSKLRAEVVADEERKEAPEINLTETENLIDQQGRGSNWYDCGPIVFSNIADYAAARHLKISAASSSHHNEQILQARINDIKVYSDFSGVDIVETVRDLVAPMTKRREEQILSIKAQFEDKEAQKLQEFQDCLGALDPSYVSMFFDIIDNHRLVTGENIGAAYSLAELEHGYELLLVEINRSNSSVDIRQTYQEIIDEKEQITRARKGLEVILDNI